MKRIASIFLFIMLASILAACGGNDTASDTPAESSAAAAPSEAAIDAEPSEASGEASAEASEAAPAADASASAEASEAAPATDASASAEPTAVSVGASGGQPVTVWHNWGGGYADAITELLGQWASDNNIALQLLQVPDIGTKVNVAVPAGQGPDIIAWVNDQIGKNAELGVIQPIEELGFDQAYLQENFVETAVQAMQYQDQIWGVPESMESLVLVYNKDLVSEDELPQTVDELIANAQQFNQENEGKYYFVYQAGTQAGDAYHNAPWWYGNGAYYVNEEGQVGLNTPESYAAGELLKQFSTIMPQEIDYDVSRALFTEGNAAMWMTGPWALADVETAGINYGVAALPAIAEGKPASPFVGVKIMMLAEGAQNPEGAAELMRYYGSAEFQTELARQNRQVPANKQAQEQVQDDPIIAALTEAANNGVPLPNTPFMDVMWAPTGEAQAAIWFGTQEPQAALDAAAEVATQNIEQIR